MNNKHFLLKIAVIAIALTLPGLLFVWLGWPKHIDYEVHALTLKNVSQQLWSGDWRPHWLVGINAGLGSPIFLFQPPLYHFLGASLQWLAPYDPNGLGRLWIVACFCMMIGGYACYAWLREYFGPQQAEFGAILHLMFPFNINNLYESCTFTSIAGTMVFPIMLLCATRMHRDPVRYVPYYALSQAALVFAHLPSVIIFNAVPWLYAIISAKDNRLRTFVSVSFAAGLGIALAASYWWVLIVNKSFILYDQYSIGPFNYNINFVTVFHTGWSDIIQVSLAIVIPSVFCAWNVRKLSPLEYHKKEMIFWMVIFCLSVLMAFPVSKPVWDTLAILHNLQFPFRFFAVAIPPLVFMAANWLPKLKNASMFLAVYSIAAIMILHDSNRDLYSSNLSRYMANVLYNQLMPQSPQMTQWMRNADIRDPRNPPSRFLRVPPYKTIQGNAELSGITQTPRSFHFHAHVATPSALVRLHRYYYPGWVVPEGMPLGISIAENDALLAVNLPQGDYDVEIDQPWFPGEKLGDGISAAALAIILSWIGVVRYQSKKTIPA